MVSMSLFLMRKYNKKKTILVNMVKYIETISRFALPLCQDFQIFQIFSGFGIQDLVTIIVINELFLPKIRIKSKLFGWLAITFVVLYIIMSRTSFRVNPHSLVCQNVKELLALKFISDSNVIRTHNHLVRKRTLNQWLGVRLRTKWLWVRIQLLSFKHLLCYWCQTWH